jgi:hypothetical protein
MSENQTSVSDNPASSFPVIRQITAGAIPRWLQAGWRDFQCGGKAISLYTTHPA